MLGDRRVLIARRDFKEAVGIAVGGGAYGPLLAREESDAIAADPSFHLVGEGAHGNEVKGASGIVGGIDAGARHGGVAEQLTKQRNAGGPSRAEETGPKLATASLQGVEQRDAR